MKPTLISLFALFILAIMAACQNSVVETTPRPTSVVSTVEPTPTSDQASLPGGETATTAPSSIPTIEPTAVVPSFPAEGSLQWVESARGFSRPLGLLELTDGSGRLLVLEQAGVIRIVTNGQVEGSPFLDLTDRVGANGNEQGLLGMALEPDFASTGRFYLNYTDRRGDTVISRFLARDGMGDPSSEVVLLQVQQPYANHNGGGLAFGPDGYLYISLGDGGSGGDPKGNAQNPESRLGKLLRIDVIGQESYTIPPGNPYATSGGAQEIWASGLRNPWRFSFDRLTGDLYIADVGQNQWEELDFYPAGSPPGPNFGWDYYEAEYPFEGTPPNEGMFIMPVWSYGRDLGCSVTGGFVYRGQSIPALQGIYLYSDYCSGDVWGLLRDGSGTWQAKLINALDVRVSAFGEDASGEIYLLDHAGGVLYRLAAK